MKLAIVILLSSYSFLNAVRDYYVRIDTKSKSDNYSVPRRNWHRASFAQITCIFLFIAACLIFDLHFDFSIYWLLSVSLLTYRVMMDNVKNLMEDRNVLYIEKDGAINGTIHWIADKIGMPAEILSLVITLTLLTLSIIL